MVELEFGNLQAICSDIEPHRPIKGSYALKGKLVCDY